MKNHTFDRQIEQNLIKWKTSSHRKPLILRGARQVGKTTLINKFAVSYPYRIILNLEKRSDRIYFDLHDDAKTLIEALFLSRNLSLDKVADTLLFLDEIQASPKAIQLLRYFHEEIPAMQVIAAGSLLEFAMRDVQSFPVGRIEYLYLHPLNFVEYLKAIGHTEALQQLNQIPIKPFAHSILLDLFNQYAIIGGMPEVISRFIEKGHMTALPGVYESIWGAYRDDVEKYASNNTERRVIKHVMETAHLYLDQRIKFQHFGNSNYRSREVSEAIHNLDRAKIIQTIYPTTDVEIPIKPNLKKAPRLQFLDTGLVNHTLGIQAILIGLEDLATAYKGALVPHLITQEIISLNTINNKKPNFWVREKRQSSAEVDLVVVHRDKVIPIEIKSGSVGRLKSLHQFVERTNHPYAIRIYAGEFKVEKSTTSGGKPYLLMNLPYYLGTQLPPYIDFFVDHYSI